MDELKSFIQSNSFGGYGLLGALVFVGGISGIIILLKKFTNKKDDQIISSEAVYNYKKEESEKKIELIDNTQEKILKVIDEQTDLTEETKSKINKVIDKAIVDIKTIEEKKTVKEIHDTIVDNWDNL